MFGTAAFTALLMTWAFAYSVIRNTNKARKYAQNHKFCYACGISYMLPPRSRVGKKTPPLGFKLNEHDKGDEYE